MKAKNILKRLDSTRKGRVIETAKSFLKGIVVGIGGIAPGLSGSVLMVILGLYTKVIGVIATLFKDFKKNVLFLLPIGLGIMCGIVLFSNFIKFSMANYEIQTRLAFLGLLIGAVPLFYREVSKEKKLKKEHFLLAIMAFILGLYFLTFYQSGTGSGDLNILQSFILGVVGISSMIIPGIDGAALLSALGLYDNWLDLTSLTGSISVYIPAGFGVIAAGFILSMIINKMIKKNYTTTFSVLFGLFLSIIPSVLKRADGSFISLDGGIATYIGIILFIGAVLFSYFFGKLNQEHLQDN